MPEKYIHYLPPMQSWDKPLVYSNNTTSDPSQVTCPVCQTMLQHPEGCDCDECCQAMLEYLKLTEPAPDIMTIGERAKNFQDAQDLMYNLNAPPGWEP